MSVPRSPGRSSRLGANDRARVARATQLWQSARASANAMRFHDAVLRLQRALRVLGERPGPDDAALRVRILVSLAFCDAEVRSFDDGVEHLHTAGKLLPEVPDAADRAELEAVIEAQHGGMLLRVGRFEESVAVLGRAVSVGERNLVAGANNRLALATDLVNRALANAGAGHPGLAQRDLRRVVEIAESEQDAGDDRLAVLAAKAHYNHGSVARRVGDVPRALRHYQEASRTFRELSPGLLPKVRLDLAEALLVAGLAQEAATNLDEVLPELRKQHDRQNLAEAESMRAAAALLSDDGAGARRFAESARRRFLRRGSPEWAAIAALVGLRAEVAAALARGRVPKRLPARALALAEELGRMRLVDEAAVARMLAVRLNLRSGAVGEAEEQLGLVPSPRRVTPMDHRMLLRLCRAELAVAQANRRRALRQSGAGFTELGRLRDRMGGLELVSGTAVHGRELGELAVRLVLDGPRPDARRLFTWLERTRAQVYRYEPLPPTENPELVERVQEYRLLSRNLQEVRVRGEGSRELSARHAALQRDIIQMGWQDTAWGRARPMAGPDEVAGLLADRVLVSFVASGPAMAAVVLADGRARLARLGAVADASAAARELHADLDALSPDHLPAPLAAAVTGSARLRAARLDEQLLRPLRNIIGDRELVVVPTGDLYAVAWGALPSLRGRPVTVAPSATAWLTATRTADGPASPPGPTLLVAGPGLRVAVGELGRLRRQHPAAVALDGDGATVRGVLDGLDGAALAHVAAHGAHEPENALFSRLELADGALYAHEIARLRRPPRHVVLAACELALSRIRPGDEALGFAGALLASGGRTVTAPVTRVGDLAAAEAMADYHHRLAAGVPPAAALAAATAVEPFRRPFVCLGAGSA